MRPAEADGLARLLRTAIAGRARSGALQRYELLVSAAAGAATSVAGEYRVPGAAAEFEAQQFTVAPAARGITAAIAPAAPPTVRVSDDGHMAVEHTNLTARQPKVFYASTTVWQASNVRLVAVGSDYELYADRTNALEVTLADGTQRLLDRVLPRYAAAPAGGAARVPAQEGLTMNVGQDCIEVARAVMQHANAHRVPRLGVGAVAGTDYADFRVARAMAAWADAQSGIRSLWADAAKDARNAFAAKLGTGPMFDAKIVNKIAASYKALMTSKPAVAAQAAQALGVNLFAAPDVGEAYETYRIANDAVPTRHDVAGVSVRDFWGQHIGAVIAQSGGDRVTLENYARTTEIGKMEDLAAHYYFQMYGPATKPAQTWHAAWTAPAAGVPVSPPVGLPADAGRDALTVVVRH